MTLRCYVAGPMTGYAQLNYPGFHAEAARLRHCGHDVVSPAELNAGLEHEGYHACMKRDIDALVTCDAIVLLPGWEKSKGAKLERHIAEVWGLRIFETAELLLNLEDAR